MKSVRAIIPRLLHIANSCPPPTKARRDRFYAMKQRILRWLGTENGYDVQHIEGKSCWSCGGTGGWCEPYDCWRCDGTGWFKSPVWVLLKRWKFGQYTFHEPVQRLYHKPDTNTHVRPVIVGYVEHASYPLKEVRRARLILCLLFDWPMLWNELDNWWIRVVLSRRCHICKRRLWSARKYQCSPCHRVTTVLKEDHDVPF